MKSKADIRKLLSMVPNLDQDAALTFRYLTLGLSNENYWLRLGNREYVLRIIKKERQQ